MDQPPNYFTTMNTIVPTTDVNMNLNSDSDTNTNANANTILNSAISRILNNEQVVRPQATVPPFEEAKTTDADSGAPFPQHG